MTTNILFHMHNNLLHTFCLFFFFHYYMSFFSPPGLLHSLWAGQIKQENQGNQGKSPDHTEAETLPCRTSGHCQDWINQHTGKQRLWVSTLNCSPKGSEIDSSMSITSVCIHWPEISTGGNMTMSNCILGKITKFIFHKVIDEFKRIRAKLSFSF